MGISPWYVGQTGEAFTIYCRYDSNLPIPLYNDDGSVLNASAFTLLITPAHGVETSGGGLFAIINADNGLVAYQPANSDVVVAGTFDIAVRIQKTSGPIYSDKEPWVIKSR